MTDVFMSKEVSQYLDKYGTDYNYFYCIFHPMRDEIDCKITSNTRNISLEITFNTEEIWKNASTHDEAMRELSFMLDQKLCLLLMT